MLLLARCRTVSRRSATQEGTDRVILTQVLPRRTSASEPNFAEVASYSLTVSAY